MSWERYDDSGTRWSWTADDQRHLLFFDTAAGELREYHEVPGGPVTVHVYQPDDLFEGRTESHGDPTAVVYPLLETTHMRTYELGDSPFTPWVRTLDDREVFEWLASAGYAP